MDVLELPAEDPGSVTPEVLWSPFDPDGSGSEVSGEEPSGWEMLDWIELFPPEPEDDGVPPGPLHPLRAASARDIQQVMDSSFKKRDGCLDMADRPPEYIVHRV